MALEPVDGTPWEENPGSETQAGPRPGLGCGAQVRRRAPMIPPEPPTANRRWPTLDGRPPVVIAHRGASGYLPEHTLESYRLAIEMGADFIEPDLVATRDGHLIARHEPLLDATTDVARRPRFASRRCTRALDGIETRGFFACDFTLAEIRELVAVQARAERPQEPDGRFRVPTLEEILELARAAGTARGRAAGVYLETKHPTFHAALGLPLEARLLDTLASCGWADRAAPVVVQSFETANLRWLRPRTGARLVQLLDASGLESDGTLRWAPPADRPYDRVVAGDPRGYREMATPEGLAEIAGYADGIGPWKRYLVGLRAQGAVAGAAAAATTPPTDLVARAHAAGLFVHAFTFRDEAAELAPDYGGDPIREYHQFFALGVDGVFSDFPDRALAARDAFTGG